VAICEEIPVIVKVMLVAALASATPGARANTQVVAVRAGDRISGMDHLPPGTRRYVRYVAKPDGSRQLIDLWQRTVRLEPQGAGPRKLHIVQRWDSARDGSTLIQDSWFNPTTFVPLTHVRRLTKDGKTTVLGYTFGTQAVTGLGGLPASANDNFRMPLTEPVYNFEYDMEMFEVLPLAAGKTFDIPFYDAGIDKAPRRYRFTVAGSDQITSWNGNPVDCWLLTGEYGTGKVLNRFWISKDSHVLVREEGGRPDGSALVKALLPGEPSQADGWLGGTEAQAPQDDVSALLLKHTQEFSDAGQAGRGTAMGDLLDDRVVFFNEGGDRATKADMAAATPVRGGTGVTTKMMIEDWDCQLHGNVAVVSFIDDQRQDYHGQPFRARYRSVETWLRNPAGWSMIGSATIALHDDPRAIALSRAELDQYVGQYEAAPGIGFTFTRVAGDLVASAGGNTAVQQAEVRDVFFTPGRPLFTKVFERNNANKVIGFFLRREGHHIHYRRVSSPSVMRQGSAPTR
jgi:hypothetical protein